MNDTFNFSDKHRKSVITIGVVGLLLVVFGFFMSNYQPSHHGGGEGGEKVDSAKGKAGGHHGSLNQGEKSPFTLVNLPQHDPEDTSLSPDDVKRIDSTNAAIAAQNKTNAAAHAAKAETKKETAVNKPYEEDTINLYRIDDYDMARAPLHPGQYKEEHHHAEVTAMNKFGGALLMGTWFFLGVSVFGIFFLAFGYTANASWFIAFKRIPEVFYRFIPIAGVLMLIVWFAFGKSVYGHWTWVKTAADDDIIYSKLGFLNAGFFIFSIALVTVLWTFFGHKMRTLSIAEDKEGGTENYYKRRRTSIAFLPLFAFPFCLIAFLWLMSLEPHWFSTMYGVNCFAGIFVSGITIIMLITTKLKDNGYLPEVTSEHLHDMGKLMFAFSIFWTYTWISQYLLIWYANIPEETAWYRFRFEHYKFLFFLNIFLNFVFPFLVLMMRNIKRYPGSLRSIGIILLCGRFLDLYLLVAPGVVGEHTSVGFMMMSGGMILVMASIFLFIIYKGIEQAPLTAKNHPYAEESRNHSTGVG